MDSPAILARLRVVCPALAPRLEPGRTLAACGLDSLEFVDLLCAIEAEFRVRLTVADLTPGLAVDELLALVAARQA